MFTFTDANDIEWAYDVFETVEEAILHGKSHFDKSANILIGEIGNDNKVIAIEDIDLIYGNTQEWGEIYHPILGQVMTYYPLGVPAYDSYTKPYVDNEGDVCCYKYDHDEGYWMDEIMVICNYTGEKVINL